MLQPLSGDSPQSQTILYAKAKHISSSEISKWLFYTEPFNILLGDPKGMKLPYAALSDPQTTAKFTNCKVVVC
jgi:hypothetical protein